MNLTMMTRVEGWYYVKYKGKWIVAQWHVAPTFASWWSISNSVQAFSDNSFEEVDELKIEQKPYLSDEDIKLWFDEYMDRNPSNNPLDYETFKKIYYPNNRPA